MEKCKVILLNPPTAAPSTEILLNLAYLSSTLKKAGHEVKILDGTAPYNPLDEEMIQHQIRKFNPNFIGVTLTITYIPQTYEYLERLHTLKIPIVAGGPHANCLPEEVLQHGVDIVSIGEGEDTILELTEYFLGKKELEDVAGVCFRKDDGTIHYTKSRPLIKDLDRLPFPDYSDFPISYYTGSDDPNSNPIFFSLFSSRGCPYNCIFCSSHNVFGRTYRIRSPQNVFEEIEDLAENYQAQMFAFQDDEAFIDKKRILEFCNLVKSSRFSLRFSGRLRIDSLGEEMLKGMKSTGFVRLAFGIESFNDETLKKINKKYNIATIAKGFKFLEGADFPAVYYNNLIGFPWETPKHLEQNLGEISKIPKSIIYFSSSATLIPYPGTKLYEENHKKYGFTNWWLDPKKNSPSSNLHKMDAFFMLFLLDQSPLYLEDIFWNHSLEMKKAIEKFCWKDSSMYLKRCLTRPEYFFVYYLSKVSHWLWKRFPTLEKAIFSPLIWLAKRFEFDKKTMFIYRDGSGKFKN